MADVPFIMDEKYEKAFPFLKLPCILFEEVVNLMDPMSLANLSILSKRSNQVVFHNIKRPIPMHLSLRSPHHLQLQSAAYPGETYIWKFDKVNRNTEKLPTIFFNDIPIRQQVSHQLEGPRVTYIHSLYFDRFEYSLKKWAENLLKIYGAEIESVYMDLSPSYELGINILYWLKTLPGGSTQVVGVEGYGFTMKNFQKHLGS